MRYGQGVPSDTTELHRVDAAELQHLAVPVLTILTHPDVDRVGDRALLLPLKSEQEMTLSRLHPDFKSPGQFRGRPLGDKHLSRKPFRLIPHGSSDPALYGAIEWDRTGTKTSLRTIDQWVDQSICFSLQEIAEGVVLQVGKRVVLLLHHRPPVVPETPRFGLVGESPGMAKVRREIKMLAELDVPALLSGEIGTGKETVARAIHSRSIRREKPWLKTNVATIPPDRILTRLFGSVRGNVEEEGLIEQAFEGTLLLDEIDAMPHEAQIELTKTLESGEFTPVGASKARPMRTRIIATTAADLTSSEGLFHPALLTCLARYGLRIPPLRERREDFGRLFYHFLSEELREVDALGRVMNSENPWPPARLTALLAAYDWPGNLDQLKRISRLLARTEAAEDEATLFQLIEERLGIVDDLSAQKPVSRKVKVQDSTKDTRPGTSPPQDEINAPTIETQEFPPSLPEPNKDDT